MLLVRPPLALAVIVLLALTVAAPAADVKLVETVWLAQSNDCPIRQIKFHDFGQAEVYAKGIGSDSGTWNFDPPVLHVFFDNWNGNLDGQIIGADEFQATYTWRSDDTLAPTSTACPFKPQQ